jgi:outer membrane protein OmpA-like peptidoglycan-associated protein
MGGRGSTYGRWIAIGAAGALVILLAAGITMFVKWSGEMNRQMVALAERVERSGQDARRAAEEATRSAAAAAEAREQSRTAEIARSDALQQKTDAEATAAEATREAQAARAEAEKIRKGREQEMARLQQALDKIVDTRRTAFGLIMNLPESALRFDFNSAELRPEARETLSRIAGILMTSDNYGLAVHGHTDDVGTAEYNQQLSERRAEAVKQYLVSAGIDPGIVTIKGFGKSSPIATGRDEASRAKNRRVDIALTDSTIQYNRQVIRN